jgi:ankyrin repeat protein
LVGSHGIIEEAQLLLQMDSEANSSLHMAALCGHGDVIKFLIDEKHHPVDILNHQKQTCLHLVCMGGGPDVAESVLRIISQPPSDTLSNKELTVEQHQYLLLGALDAEGNSALHYAAKYSQPAAVDILLQHCDRDKRLADLLVRPNNRGQIPAFCCLYGNVNGVSSVAVILSIISRRPDLLLRKFKVRDPRPPPVLPAPMVMLQPVPGQIPQIVQPPTPQTETVYTITTTLLQEALIASSYFTLPLLKGIFDRFPELGDGILTSVDDQGWSVLHVLAGRASKAEQVATFLLEKGADVNFVDSGGRTCVHVALQRDDCDWVEGLIRAACDDEYDFKIRENSNGWTVLHCCAWSTTHSNCAELLVKQKPEIADEVDRMGNTPLLLALQREQYGAASHLITSNNVNKPNASGVLPLIMALRQCTIHKPKKKMGNTAPTVSERRGLYEVIEEMLRYDVDLTVVDNDDPDQPGVIMLAVESLLPEHVIGAILRKNNKEVNKLTKNSKLSPLHIACEEDHLGLVRLLVNYGCNVYQADASNAIPLVYAISNGYEEVCNELWNCVFDEDDVDEKKLLKKIKEDVSESESDEENDESGRSKQFLSEVARQRAVVLLNKLSQTELDSLMLECSRRNTQTEIVLHVLRNRKQSKKMQLERLGKEREGNWHVFRDSGDNNVTLLMVCAQEGHVDLVTEYLEFVSLFETIDGKEPPEGISILQMAVDERDDEGNSSLHYCIMPHGANHKCQGYMKMTILTTLIAKGASVNLQNNVGDTPLHLACRHGVALLAQTLTSNGADLAIENTKAQTPEEVANEFGHYSIVSKLLPDDAEEEKPEEKITRKRKRKKTEDDDDEEYDAKKDEGVQEDDDIISEDEEEESEKDDSDDEEPRSKRKILQQQQPPQLVQLQQMQQQQFRKVPPVMFHPMFGNQGQLPPPPQMIFQQRAAFQQVFVPQNMGHLPQMMMQPQFLPQHFQHIQPMVNNNQNVNMNGNNPQNTMNMNDVNAYFNE